MTIEEFLKEIEAVFEKAGIENPALEAQIMASHILSCNRTYLFTHKDEELDDKVLLASAALINERCKRRPLQYIIGKAAFRKAELIVDERVLIPRPETEELVEEALRLLKDAPSPKVLDLCTGSGCIAVSMAIERPDCAVTATDLSPKAFMLASVNARPYGNIKLFRGDLFDALKDKDELFDAILTNPPYIPSEAIESLQQEVRDFEPHMALDGGKSGLDIIERILKEAPKHLKPSGFLLMETGDEQKSAVLSLAQSLAPELKAEYLKDISGKDRIFKWTQAANL